MTDESTNMPEPAPPAAEPRTSKIEPTSLNSVSKALDKVMAEPNMPEPDYARDAPEVPEDKAPAKEAKAEPKAEPKAKEPAKEAKAEPKEAKEPTKAEPAKSERDETGRFKARETGEEGQEATAPAKPAAKDDWSNPPDRISPKAREAWANADPEVRREVHRRLDEMTRGIEDYQQRFGPLKEYERLASEHKTTIKDALDRYTAFERGLQQNPVQGLRMIAQDMGFDLQAVARQIVGAQPQQGQQPGQQPQQRPSQDPMIQSMHQEISQLKQHIQQMSQQTAQEKEQVVLKEVEDFAAEHPRFDELSEDIALLLRSKRAVTLRDAYFLAERLNPGAEDAGDTVQARSTPAQDAVQARPEEPLSVSGKPSGGRVPNAKKVPKTSREAVETRLNQILG